MSESERHVEYAHAGSCKFCGGFAFQTLQDAEGRSSVGHASPVCEEFRALLGRPHDRLGTVQQMQRVDLSQPKGTSVMGAKTTRVHEWCWPKSGRRTVCGLLPMRAGSGVTPATVENLGLVPLAERCQNCERMRSATGCSAREPEVGDPYREAAERRPV
jgi:hypothetical protein